MDYIYTINLPNTSLSSHLSKKERLSNVTAKGVLVEMQSEDGKVFCCFKINKDGSPSVVDIDNATSYYVYDLLQNGIDLGITKEYKTYVMKDSNTGFFKIGKSVNPSFREKTLQSEKPTITKIFEFPSDVELSLHKKYSDKRVRGEWFALTDDDLIDINAEYGL